LTRKESVIFPRYNLHPGSGKDLRVLVKMGLTASSHPPEQGEGPEKCGRLPGEGYRQPEERTMAALAKFLCEQLP
jgi:hypothetical protein